MLCTKFPFLPQEPLPSCLPSLGRELDPSGWTMCSALGMKLDLLLVHTIQLEFIIVSILKMLVSDVSVSHANRIHFFIWHVSKDLILTFIDYTTVLFIIPNPKISQKTVRIDLMGNFSIAPVCSHLISSLFKWWHQTSWWIKLYGGPSWDLQQHAMGHSMWWLMGNSWC